MIILCGTCNEEIPLHHACMHQVDAGGIRNSYHFSCAIAKPKLKQNEKLDLINSIEVLEASACGGDLEYVQIELSQQNLDILMSIGATSREIYEVTEPSDGTIDISGIGFKYTNAQWFQENLGGFLELEPKSLD